jgi:hypothetical protein
VIAATGVRFARPIGGALRARAVTIANVAATLAPVARIRVESAAYGRFRRFVGFVGSVTAVGSLARTLSGLLLGF